MKFYLIRHAETEWNVAKKLQGWGDGALTENGIEQSRLLGKRLTGMKFGKIYCSSSGRTRRTLDIALGSVNAVYLDSLREISLGKWEGRLQSEISAENPEQFENFWHHPEKFSSDGGEDFYKLFERVGDSIREIAGKENDDFIVISHTAAIRAAVSSLQNKGVSSVWDGDYLKPTSVTCFEYSGGKFNLIYFGDASHLE